MKNKLSDLNDHLFAQLERLGEEQLSGEKLKDEIDRTKAVTAVSMQIISNASLVLQAEKLRTEFDIKGNETLKRLTG